MLVVAYYQSVGVREAAAVIAHWKVQGGLALSFVAGFAAGSVVPEVAKLMTAKIPSDRRAWLNQTLFNGFAYGSLAIQIDLFYQWQNHIFGPEVNAFNLIIKMLVDMAIVAPLVFVPYMMALFEGRRAGFRAGLSVWTWNGYRDKVLPALLPNWAFWIPVVLCVYAMPPNLQFPFSTLAEAAWSIVFVFIATRE